MVSCAANRRSVSWSGDGHRRRSLRKAQSQPMVHEQASQSSRGAAVPSEQPYCRSGCTVPLALPSRRLHLLWLGRPRRTVDGLPAAWTCSNSRRLAGWGSCAAAGDCMDGGLPRAAGRDQKCQPSDMRGTARSALRAVFQRCCIRWRRSGRPSALTAVCSRRRVLSQPYALTAV